MKLGRRTIFPKKQINEPVNVHILITVLIKGYSGMDYGFTYKYFEFASNTPGRQMIGSFHPVEDEDWSNGAYFTAEMNELFVAANSDNSESMMKLLESGLSPNSTDFTGRTALHITAFSGSTKCAQILLEHGARMITRMTDGRFVPCSDLLAVFKHHIVDR